MALALILRDILIDSTVSVTFCFPSPSVLHIVRICIYLLIGRKEIEYLCIRVMESSDAALTVHLQQSTSPKTVKVVQLHLTIPWANWPYSKTRRTSQGNQTCWFSSLAFHLWHWPEHQLSQSYLRSLPHRFAQVSQIRSFHAKYCEKQWHCSSWGCGYRPGRVVLTAKQGAIAA